MIILATVIVVAVVIIITVSMKKNPKYYTMLTKTSLVSNNRLANIHFFMIRVKSLSLVIVPLKLDTVILIVMYFLRCVPTIRN